MSKKPFRISLIVFITVLIIGLPASATTKFESIHGFEPHFVRPGNGDGLKDIRADFNAKGDGKTDDTQAFKKWLASNSTSLFLPEGTYLVSEPIRYTKKRVFIIGERRSKTIIKLMDTSKGFHDPDNPQVFWHTRPDGVQGEQNFGHIIKHVTFEIGKNNPGAVCLNYHVSNTGFVRDVTIRATDPVNHKGLTGLQFAQYWHGPGGAYFVEIEGFGDGIRITDAQNYTVVEHATIQNCNRGIWTRYECTLRDIDILNCKTGITNQSTMVLLESRFTGNGSAAIENSGKCMIRDLETSGYGKAIQSSTPSGDVSGPDVDWYASHEVKYNWTPENDKKGPIGIPIEEAPEYQYPQTAVDWAVCKTTSAIQAAIDNGKKCVYVPSGTGQSGLKGKLVLRNNLERIQGLGLAFGSIEETRIDDGNTDAVICELAPGGHFKLNSKRTLVQRKIGVYDETTPNGYGGKVFITECVSAPFVFKNISVYLRNINTEKEYPVTNIVFDNCTAVIMGHKTEDMAPKLKAINGSFLEVLGTKHRQNRSHDLYEKFKDVSPMIELVNSHAGITYTEAPTWSGAGHYKYLIKETRGSETRSLMHTTHGGTGGNSEALFVGYTSWPSPTSIESTTSYYTDHGEGVHEGKTNHPEMKKHADTYGLYIGNNRITLPATGIYTVNLADISGRRTGSATPHILSGNKRLPLPLAAGNVYFLSIQGNGINRVVRFVAP